jgi:hypothetical protein
VDAVKAKATLLLNSITQDDLQHCFQQWKNRMERCRDREGDYIEGNNISIVCFFSITGYSMNPVSLLPHLVYWTQEFTTIFSKDPAS